MESTNEGFDAGVSLAAEQMRQAVRTLQRDAVEHLMRFARQIKPSPLTAQAAELEEARQRTQDALDANDASPRQLGAEAMRFARTICALVRTPEANSLMQNAARLFGAPVTAGSLWRHYNGNVYTVLLVANQESANEERYPKTVVYIGGNGKCWSRPLDDWHRSMTPLEESRPAEGAAP